MVSLQVVPAEAPAFSDFHVAPAVWAAKRRGVLFDVGHGSASFSWTVAELAAGVGFWPDIISTDIHIGSINGPVYDLPTVMTKMLMVGMPLADVVAASTAAPARALGVGGVAGSLAVGREADIAVLDLLPVDVMLEDSQSQLRRCTTRLVCSAVWRAGEAHRVTAPECAWPNEDVAAINAQTWEVKFTGLTHNLGQLLRLL